MDGINRRPRVLPQNRQPHGCRLHRGAFLGKPVFLCENSAFYQGKPSLQVRLRTSSFLPSKPLFIAR